MYVLSDLQRTTVQRLTQEVQQNQKEVTAIKRKQVGEEKPEEKGRNYKGDWNYTDSGIIAEFRAAKVKAFYFPKFSTFSGEDPRPKTEWTVVKWKYEVSCLRKN